MLFLTIFFSVFFLKLPLNETSTDISHPALIGAFSGPFPKNNAPPTRTRCKHPSWIKYRENNSASEIICGNRVIPNRFVGSRADFSRLAAVYKISHQPATRKIRLEPPAYFQGRRISELGCGVLLWLGLLLHDFRA